jgi:hypothetical protein
MRAKACRFCSNRASKRCVSRPAQMILSAGSAAPADSPAAALAASKAATPAAALAASKAATPAAAWPPRPAVDHRASPLIALGQAVQLADTVEFPSGLEKHPHRDCARKTAEAGRSDRAEHGAEQRRQLGTQPLALCANLLQCGTILVSTVTHEASKWHPQP